MVVVAAGAAVTVLTSLCSSVGSSLLLCWVSSKCNHRSTHSSSSSSSKGATNSSVCACSVGVFLCVYTASSSALRWSLSRHFLVCFQPEITRWPPLLSLSQLLRTDRVWRHPVVQPCTTTYSSSLSQMPERVVCAVRRLQSSCSCVFQSFVFPHPNVKQLSRGWHRTIRSM
jgi:hypothetical protein